MKIDPKQIARMITEDPDEVAPSDHFDDFEDEYEHDMGEYVFCSSCNTEFDASAHSLELCENCESAWCERCLPGGSIWENSDKEEKLHFQIDPPIDVNSITSDGFWDVYEMLLRCPHCFGDEPGYPSTRIIGIDRT